MDSEKIEILILGSNIGFWCIGMLFYIIQLTGPLTSLPSILYLFTIFSFGLTSLSSYLLEINMDSDYAYVYQILLTIFANFSASYFAILVVNTYKIIERKWLYFICVLPLPMGIVMNLWCLQDIFNLYKINSGMSASVLSIMTDLFAVTTQFAINTICYFKFTNFKGIPGFKSLLNQYVAGLVFSLIIDVILRVISFHLHFGERTIVQICVVSGYINLNLEFFLLNRIRMILMSHIIMHNS
jgi:hypothetical protein